MSASSPLRLKVAEYQVSLRTAPGAFAVGYLLAALLAVAGLDSRPVSYPAILTGAMILAFLVRLQHCRVTLAPEALYVRGVLHRVSLPWDAKVEVRRAADTSFLASRVYGPFTWEFRSPTTTARINFKLYSLACFHGVMSRAAQAGWTGTVLPPSHQ